MHFLEKRALYNLVRMNWLQNPRLKVEAWKVENYRKLTQEALFQRLTLFSIHLQSFEFVHYANECESPEELAECLIGDTTVSTEVEDQVYLIIFELWRRLMKDKPSFSIVCDELDYQIHCHDNSTKDSFAPLQLALQKFIFVLNENVDQGLTPQEAFKQLTVFFANDIENFLYDYIFELIDKQELYAQELLESLSAYVQNNPWFRLLSLRLCLGSNPNIASKMTEVLIEEYLDEKDADFNLEFLALLNEYMYVKEFHIVALKTLSSIQIEEEFQDLLAICADFYQKSGKNETKSVVRHLLSKRLDKNIEGPVNKNDEDLKRLLEILS